MARHAYWVILAGSTPTAFRASTREALVPTLRQLQRTQPDVTLRWFERGRLWESPEAARFGLRAPRPSGRDRTWRPGGEHRDPRAQWQLTRDQKRARFKARARRAPLEPGPEDAERPAGGPPDRPVHDRPRRPWKDHRRGPDGPGQTHPRSDEPGGRPDRAPDKPAGASGGPKKPWGKPAGRGPWRRPHSRPGGPSDGRPRSHDPGGAPDRAPDKPGSAGGRPKKPWGKSSGRTHWPRPPGGSGRPPRGRGGPKRGGGHSR